MIFAFSHTPFPPPQPDSNYDKRMKKLANSPFKGLVIGLAGGFIEVGINQPLISIKNILQKRIFFSNETGNQSIWKTLSIRQLYGGGLANGLGMSGLIGVQMGCFGLAKNFLSQENDPKSFSKANQLLASTFAGIAGAPIACFSELVMDQHREKVKAFEQNHNLGQKPSYVDTIKKLKQLGGKRTLTLGLSPTIGREVGFTIAYTAGAPSFAQELIHNPLFQAIFSTNRTETMTLTANIISGIIVGAIGATVTQPFDTWKTLRQSELLNKFRETNLSNYHQTKHLVPKSQACLHFFQHRILWLYSGFLPRCTRVMAAVTLLNLVNTKAEVYLSKFKTNLIEINE